jgi:ATP-dependent Clp protease adapter protein ClpS
VLSPAVQRVLDSAAAEARRRGNPVLTLEHAVYALADDPEGAALLSACGAKLGPLRADVARHLDELPTTGGADPAQAVELQAALQQAATHALAVERAQITAGDFLAAVLLDRTTHAVAALTLQRVTRLSVVIHLSHDAPYRTAVRGLPAARLLGRGRFLSRVRRALAGIADAVSRWTPRGASARYDVLLHNDDYTARDFVVVLLVTLFSRTPADAQAITQRIHVHGIGSAGRYSLREARRLVERATALARGVDYPLRLSIQRAR